MHQLNVEITTAVRKYSAEDKYIIAQNDTHHTFFQYNSCSEILRSCILHSSIFSLYFPVPHLPVLHFPTLEMWSLIFESCRSVFDIFAPSLEFPVLYFQWTR